MKKIAHPKIFGMLEFIGVIYCDGALWVILNPLKKMVTYGTIITA
ncbi:MAG: hypothetical protein ACXVCY_06340 [Pseudobdellovibrionaceae bacterium]